MPDAMKIQGPVDVRADSGQRVAFDLMEKIAYHEKDAEKAHREYWLKLYHQCHQSVVSGWAASDILQAK